MAPLLRQLVAPEACQLWEAPAAEASAGTLAAFVGGVERQGMRLGILWVVVQTLPEEGLPSFEVAACTHCCEPHA